MKNSMKLSIAVIIALIIIIASLTYLGIGDGENGENGENGNGLLLEITKTVSIDGNGTLYCKGTITEDCIVLQWIASVTFPYNENMGVLFTEGLWSGIIPAGQVGLRGPDGSLSWFGAQGEYHEWMVTITICEFNTTFEHIVDGVTVFFPEIEDGWSYISDGSHNISAYFSSVDDQPPYEDYLDVETEPFSLVRSGSDFWFE